HNTYTGPTVITSGRVRVTGNIAGPVTVAEPNPGSEEATLFGSGSVGDVTVTSGELLNSVLYSTDFVGQSLTLHTANLTLADAARASVMRGAGGSNHVAVTGTVHVAGTVGVRPSRHSRNDHYGGRPRRGTARPRLRRRDRHADRPRVYGLRSELPRRRQRGVVRLHLDSSGRGQPAVGARFLRGGRPGGGQLVSGVQRELP